MSGDLYDADEAADLRRQVAAERRYNRALCAHPHPQDPDHPGYPEEEEVEA